ncbi:hypothetical protein SaSA20_0379a [Streptococcus agalactiae]|nr:hypothetical protein SaSA20_0379a [Streptococcus agalactiae]
MIEHRKLRFKGNAYDNKFIR